MPTMTGDDRQCEVLLANARHQVDALRDVGKLFYDRSWSLGTSSNYSILLSRDPFRLLLTASGKDKRSLGSDDFVIVDENGACLTDGSGRPSAETLLHVVAASRPEVNAVLHTHSVWGTLLSDLYAPRGHLVIEGYEMLKGLTGVNTHEYRKEVVIFENSQDIATLSQQVAARFDDPIAPLRHGFLLRGHGLYTWGRDLAEARRQIEIFEFLFEVIGRRLSLPRSVMDNREAP